MSEEIIDGKKITISDVYRKGSDPLKALKGTKISIGRDPDTGKIRQHSYVKSTAQEVIDSIKKDMYSERFNRIDSSINADISIGEAIDRYISAYKNSLEPNSLYHKKNVLKLANKYLENVPITKFNVMRAEVFQAQLMYMEDVSPFVNNQTLIELSKVIHFVQGELIPVFNAIPYVKKLEVAKKKVVLPDDKQLKLFIDYVENHDGIYGDALGSQLYLGLRHGENVAIMTDAINMDLKEICIDKHIIWRRDGFPRAYNELRLNRKMHDSYYVTISSYAMHYIERALKRQEEWKLAKSGSGAK